MLKFGKQPWRNRFGATVLISMFILSTVMLIQPLGLTTVGSTDSQTEPAPTAAESDQADPLPSIDPNAFYVNDPELHNRSRSEWEQVTAETFEGEFNPNDKIVDMPEGYNPIDDVDDVPALEPFQKQNTMSFEAVDYTLYIKANQLNVRAAPSTDSTVMGTLSFGDKVTCLGENNNWTKVKYQDQLCFVKTEYTSKTMVFAAVQETLYVSANTLNLRSGPSVDDEVVTKLKKDDKLTRTGVGDGWSRVQTASGKTGYVASEHLTKTAPYRPPAASSNQGASSQPTSGGTTVSGSAGRIVELAYQALGVPYRHARHSPSNGFDCTGLAYWAYGQIGVSVPRSTGGYYSAGSGVSYANMRPGDVIGWDAHPRDGRTALTHVGIYVGGGMMIHASSNKGRVVLQSVSQYSSWGCKILTIRRFVSG